MDALKKTVFDVDKDGKLLIGKKIGEISEGSDHMSRYKETLGYLFADSKNI